MGLRFYVSNHLPVAGGRGVGGGRCPCSEPGTSLGLASLRSPSSYNLHDPNQDKNATRCLSLTGHSLLLPFNILKTPAILPVLGKQRYRLHGPCTRSVCSMCREGWRRGLTMFEQSIPTLHLISFPQRSGTQQPFSPCWGVGNPSVRRKVGLELGARPLESHCLLYTLQPQT